MSDSERAIEALRKAFEANQKNSFIAVRLSQCYLRSNELHKARKILQEALDANENDKRLHYYFGKLLMRLNSGNKEELLYHFQRAIGPANYDATLLYGRQMFIVGDLNDSRKLFRELRNAPVPIELRNRPVYPLEQVFHGQISKIETGYCFIARDGPGDWIYAYRDNIGDFPWKKLALRLRVAFKIAFTFSGTSAFDVRPEH